jgi:signal recognition particle subunit SRP54
MLDNLTTRLSGVIKNLRGHARLTEDNIKDAMREVRMALLEADVALPVVKTFINDVRERAMGHEVMGSLTPGQAVVGVVNDELTRLMGDKNDALNLAAVPPAIVLMAGLQGAGKTTTSGKLAKLLKEQNKKKVLLVSADVYRPAAIEQLKLLAQQLDVEWFPSDASQKPVDIARPPSSSSSCWRNSLTWNGFRPTPARSRWTSPAPRWTTPSGIFMMC